MLKTSRSGPGWDCLRISRRNDGAGDDVRTKGVDLGNLVGRQDLGNVALGPAHTTVGQRQSDGSRLEGVLSHRLDGQPCSIVDVLSLIHISEPTRLGMISYAVFCLKKKK